MRSSTNRRLVPVLMILTLLAAACSRVPPGGEASLSQGSDSGLGVAADDGTTDGETTDSGDGLPGGFVAPDGGDSTADGAGDGASSGDSAGGSGGGSDGSGSGSAGGSGGGQPQSGQQAAAGPGPGVAGRTINVVFHEQFSNCPGAPQNPEQRTYDKAKKVMAEYTKFFNEFVLKEHRWTLKTHLVDDGGYFCPERQRAAALKITKEIKPFAALGGSASAQGPILADVVTRAGQLHIGNNWQFQADERARHPYAWNTFSTAESSLRFMVGWAQRRIKDTTVPDRFTPGSPAVKRVYGLLGLDEQVGRELVKLTRSEMVAAGMPVKATYLVSPSAGVATQQAASLVSKMRQDGVNTLVWGLAFGDGKDFYVPFTEVMDKQNYLPDVILGTGGNAFFEQLTAKRVWANAKGTSAYSIIPLRVAVTMEGPVPEYDEVNENSSGYIEAWKKLGHNDNPTVDYGNAVGVWTNLSALASGIIHAGDVLNAHTYARGLGTAGAPGTANRCTVARFVGRDYKHVPSWDWNAAHDGGGIGYTPIYWVNKQTPLGTNGYYESYDNYVYFRSPKDIPRQPTHDTGTKGTAIKKQERIGIRPWTSCSKFPNFPR